MNAPEPDLLAVTLQLLERHRGRWPGICAATGLSYSWLTKLAQGLIRNPSFLRLQRLHEHLLALDTATAEAAA